VSAVYSSLVAEPLPRELSRRSCTQLYRTRIRGGKR